MASLGVAFRVEAPDVDETQHPGETPRQLVARLAETKLAAVAGELVLAADTIVDRDGVVFAKPRDEDDARRMLRALSGREHLVHTGVAVRDDGAVSVEVVTTHVHFLPIDEATIDRYVATGEPADKAGAYAVQGRGGAFVDRIDGSPSNVVGLPLATVAVLLGVVGVSS